MATGEAGFSAVNPASLLRTMKSGVYASFEARMRISSFVARNFWKCYGDMTLLLLDSNFRRITYIFYVRFGILTNFISMGHKEFVLK